MSGCQGWANVSVIFMPIHHRRKFDITGWLALVHHHSLPPPMSHYIQHTFFIAVVNAENFLLFF